MAITTSAPSRTADVTARPGAEGRKINAGRAAAWAAMIILILITLFPFYWMLRTAFSTSRSLFSDPNSLLPVDFTLGAFKRVLGLATTAEAQAEGGSGAAVNFWLFLRNSIVYATLSTAGQVFFSALAAYAFARLRWPGRDKVFFIFLTALMIPPIFTMLPNFILIKNLGLLNTFPGLILPYFFMTPFADLLPDHPADELGTNHHPVHPDLHQPVERVLLASPGRLQGPGSRAQRRARCVPIPDPAR